MWAPHGPVQVSEQRPGRAGAGFLERDASTRAVGVLCCLSARKHQPAPCGTRGREHNRANGGALAFTPGPPDLTRIEAGGHCSVLKRGVAPSDVNAPWPPGEQVWRRRGMRGRGPGANSGDVQLVGCWHSNLKALVPGQIISAAHSAPAYARQTVFLCFFSIANVLLVTHIHSVCTLHIAGIQKALLPG